jgi:hypothetical protein
MAATTQSAISWRAAPSKVTTLHSSVRQPSVGTISRDWPWNIRTISASRPSTAAQAADYTSSESLWRTKRNKSKVLIRKIAATTSIGDQPGTPDLLYARCAQLLNQDQNARDPFGHNNFANKTISVSGVIRTIRKQKHAAFAHVTDGSCFKPIQVVLDPELASP